LDALLQRSKSVFEKVQNRQIEHRKTLKYTEDAPKSGFFGVFRRASVLDMRTFKTPSKRLLVPLRPFF